MKEKSWGGGGGSVIVGVPPPPPPCIFFNGIALSKYQITMETDTSVSSSSYRVLK